MHLQKGHLSSGFNPLRWLIASIDAVEAPNRVGYAYPIMME
jgi:hypothetical protein